MQSMTLEQLRATAFDQWLADEIQTSIDDSRPNISDGDVMTELDALLAVLPH